MQSVFESITNFCDDLQKRLPFSHKPFISDLSKIVDKEVLNHPLCAKMAEEKQRGVETPF
jgi:hypothetical protein